MVGASGGMTVSDFLIIEEDYLLKERQRKMNNVVYAEPYNGLEWSLLVFLFILAGGILVWVYKKIGKGK
jgi:hypothetical protein